MSSSPTSSVASLEDDNWDLISSQYSQSHSDSRPAGFSSDEEGFTDDITDVASEFSREDNESADEADDAIPQGAETTAQDDLDDRVGAALASPLASTLEPFKATGSGYSSLNSSTSTASSALALSFPDPLTQSPDIRAESQRGIESLIPETSAVDIASADPSLVVDAESGVVPQDNIVPDATATTESGAVDDAPMDPANPTLNLPADDEAEEDDIHLVQVHREHLAIAFGNGTEMVLNAIHTHLVTHPWTTSIIISLLAVILGSTVFTSHANLPSTTSIPSMVRVQSSPIHTNSVFVSAVIPTKAVQSSIPCDKVVAAPVAVATPIVSVAKTPKQIPEQTPGAGPSTLKATASTAAVKRIATGKSLLPPPTKEQGQAVTSQEASSTGSTRHGCATGRCAGKDSWDSCIWASLFSGKLKNGLARRKWKGKAKEVLPLLPTLPASKPPLLLEAPKSLPTISAGDGSSEFSYRGVAELTTYPLKELKAFFYPSSSSSSSSSSKPSTEVLKVVKDAFQLALDALLSDLLKTTSALLNDLTHVRRAFEDSVKSVQRQVEDFYEATLEPMYQRNKAHVDNLKREFHSHQEKAKKRRGKVMEEVAKRFGKAKANAKVGREAVTRSFKDKESVMNTVTKGQKWLEKDARRRAGKVQHAFSRRMEKLEARRCLKTGKCDKPRKGFGKGKGRPVEKPARA